LDEICGVQNVTVSIPHLIGGQGILGTLSVPLEEDEQAQLHASAKIVRQAISGLSGSALNA
jgi:L-lactate dehydrogenase